jgi:hypothetical protein
LIGKDHGCGRRRSQAISRAATALGEQPRELRHAGPHVVVDADHVAVMCADLAPHAGEARSARLQRRDAHDVVERHPQREEACRLTGQRVVVRCAGIARVLGRPDAGDPIEVQLAVRRVLEVDHAIAAERDDLARLPRQFPRCGVCLCGGDAEREPCETRPRSTLAFVYHRLANRMFPRKDAAAGDRAEHDRAHRRAGLARSLFHVEGDETAAERARRIEQAAGVEAPVA